MGRYVLRRLAQAVGVLWAAYTLSFFILVLLPGDPVSAMAGSRPCAPSTASTSRRRCSTWITWGGR